MKNFFLFFLILLGLSLSAETSAQTELELRRFQKCYGLFVRERLPVTDSLWKQVQSGAKTGTTACMDIFSRAVFDKNGEIKKGKDGSYDYEGMRVLNTFLRFHKSRLEVPDYGATLSGNHRSSRDVIDGNEAAYHYLQALFAQEAPFSKIVTGDHSFRAKRYSTKSQRMRSLTRGPLLPFIQGMLKSVKNPDGTTVDVPDESKGGVRPFNPVLAETGILVGLVPDDEANMMDLHLPVHKSQGFALFGVTEHFGAGAIGTQAYLLANTGKDAFNDGALSLYRRWSKHVLSDFLCRELPALRSTDAIAEVQGDSGISFRQGISCMACHSSMDPMAAVLRNHRSVAVHNSGQASYPNIKAFARREPTAGAAALPTRGRDPDFYKRPPLGRLYYRSYDGKLVNVDVEGLPDLGARLEETNDLYVCAAKRYYQFLTGFDVNLADPGNINTIPFGPHELAHRNEVIRLGLELKKTQSLRGLIRSIVSSQAFIKPDREN